MPVEAERTTGATKAKELTFGKFAAILLGPAAVLLAAFVLFSLMSCGDDCETVIAGVMVWAVLSTLVVAIRFGLYGVIDLARSMSQKHTDSERSKMFKRGGFRLGVAAVLVVIAYICFVSQIQFGA